MKKKKIPDNILATAEPPTAAETEEADQEQCGSGTKKKIKIKENNLLYYSIRIIQDLYIR